MQSWQGWPLERLIYAFLAAAYLLVWAQVTLFHWRAGFHNKFMWGPVLYTPLLIIGALALVFTPGARPLFVVLFAIGALEGLAGTFLHLRGIAEMVGGFNLRNVMAGPPFILAFVYAALSLLGMLVAYWPRPGQQ
jgi:hypothetical protein